jgi:peroxiredoxin Q/BCP
MRRLAFAAAISLALAACNNQSSTTGAPSASQAAPAAPLKEGDMAPDVELTLQSGKTMRLSSLRGKTVAIYFYPKDETTGCTVEAQGIRDRWADVQAAGVTVLGVSTQDAASHQHFIEKEKLPFDLAVDKDGAVAQAFQVPLKNGLSARQTFLVDPQGRLKKIWRDVDPKQHAEQILAAAK